MAIADGFADHADADQVGEADERMHHGQLAGMIELQAGNALAVGQTRGGGQRPKLAAVDEGFQDVLLDIQVGVEDGGHLGAQHREMLDGLVDAVVGDVVGGGLGAQEEMVADVLLDEAVAVMAPDDGIRQVQVFNLGLQFPAVAFGDLTAEDRRDLGGLADRAIGIE